MKKNGLLLLAIFVATSCGVAESGDYETTKSELNYTSKESTTTKKDTYTPKNDDGRGGFTSIPGVVRVYSCCDSSNNCYDIERHESCEAGETLLWCMGDGLCEPGTNTD